MLRISFCETFIDDYADEDDDNLLVVFSLVAEHFEFFLFEQKQAVGGADFPSLGVDACNF